MELHGNSFALELGVDSPSNGRVLAVDAGPFPTMEEAFSFANRARNQVARAVLDFKGAASVEGDLNATPDEMSLPIVGCTVCGMVDGETVSRYDLASWSPVTDADVLNSLTFAYFDYTDRMELSYEGRYRTWYIIKNSIDMGMGDEMFPFELASDPSPGENNEANERNGGSVETLPGIIAELVYAENHDNGLHVTDDN